MIPALSIAAHHSEPGDPVLIAWMIHLLNTITGLGPIPIVIILGAIVIAIPAGIMTVFLIQRAKYS